MSATGEKNWAEGGGNPLWQEKWTPLRKGNLTPHGIFDLGHLCM